MDQIFGYLWGKSGLAFGMAVTFALLVASPYGQLWKNEADRKRAVGALIQSGWRLRYRRIMTAVLDWLDARLSGDELARGLGPARRAFSHDLIGLTMMLAVVYPVFAIILQWVAGSPLSPGGEEIVPAGTPVARLIFAAVLIVLGAGYGGLSLSNRFKGANYFLALLALLIVSYLAIQYGPEWGVPVIATTGGLFAIGITFLSVGGAGVSIGPTIWVSVGLVISANTDGFLLRLALVSGAFVIPYIAGIATEWYQTKKGKGSLYWVAYLGVMLAILTGFFLWVEGRYLGEIGPQNKALIAFLGLFPAMNALADFASFGLTRYLLRKGLGGHSWRAALLDVIGGAVIFVVLALSMITWLHLVRLPDGTPMLDLAALFAGLQANPGDYWWLFFMLFSTLVPTLLHAMVALFSLLLQYPAPLRIWVHDRLVAGGNGSDTAGWQGSLGYCAMITVSIWGPIAALSWLLSLDHGAAMAALIDGFDGYYQWIITAYPR